MLFSFLQSISDLVIAFIGIVMNFFTMILMLFTAVPKAITYVLGVIGYMPPFVGSVILVSIGIAVTITIINHWGS